MTFLKRNADMKTGITIHATDLTHSPVDIAARAESLGFYSFYLPEHTHIPASRLTAAPTGDEELGDQYRRTLDPYIVLAGAAVATQKILLGTGISLICQHHPITLAKCIASLDQLCGGRFVLGAGYGWNKEEMANHNIDYSRRRDMFEEWLLAMYELWDNEAGEFHGEFVDFSPSWMFPKPIVRSSNKDSGNTGKDGRGGKDRRPKVLIGGAGGPKLFQHIAKLADGWMPIGGAGIKDKQGELKLAFEKAGRDPAQLEIVPFGVLPTAEKLEYYKEIGITEAVLRLNGTTKDEIYSNLDKLAEFL